MVLRGIVHDETSSRSLLRHQHTPPPLGGPSPALRSSAGEVRRKADQSGRERLRRWFRQVKPVRLDPQPVLALKLPADDEVREVPDMGHWQYSSFYGRWHPVKWEAYSWAKATNGGRWVSDTALRIQVRCGVCGNSIVTLSYGDYECIAACLNCEHEFTVYDG